VNIIGCFDCLFLNAFKNSNENNNKKIKSMRNQVQRYIKLFLLIVGLGAFSSINAQIIEENSIKCFGDSTGRIGIYPNTGLAPFNYLWSNGVDNPDY